MRSNSTASSRDRRLPGEFATCLGLPQQLGQPGPAPAKAGLLAGQVGVELAEDLDEVPVDVAGQRVAHLVQAQAQLGKAPDAGQFNGVPQRVLAVAVGLARGLGQQADVVVVPDSPGADADEVSKFSDPHAPGNTLTLRQGHTVPAGPCFAVAMSL